ncbi:hypothetical protein V1503_23880 [Bacillus sp. SCS-151]|uniref:hypothetical protein n=1 Tax=Nanhaiella sioensis TaxID=3115293 RepID=UPI003978921E
MILHILNLIFLLFVVYFLFFKRIRKYKDVIHRGFIYSIIGLKNKEKKVYEDALVNMMINEDEQRNVMFILGKWYAKKRDYQQATYYFDLVFDEEYKKGFAFHQDFTFVIDSYLKNNQRNNAKRMLDYFLENKWVDKDYSKLEKKYKQFFINN